MSSRSSMPIIFRGEPFGGSVFDPTDGTMVELDGDAFSCAVKLFCQGESATGDEEESLEKQLLQLLTITPDRPTRFLPQKSEFTSRADYHLFSAPTLVDFQITTACLLDCPHCYAKATPEGTHVSLDDAKLIIDQCYENGVSQLALGGGEPLQHPNISEILQYTNEKGIVPNLSTNGMYLDSSTLKVLKECCGAVALSLEGVGSRFDTWRKTGFKRLKKAIKQLKKADIPTVLQVTLSEANFDELNEIVTFCLKNPHLYGVIFLAYKPVGRGEVYSRPLSSLPSQTVSDGLRKAFLRLQKSMRVGYDCCLTPAIVGVNEGLEFVDNSHLEGCSGMRGSVGISAGLDVLPCTFLSGEVMGNLRETPLSEIWESGNAEAFRGRISEGAGSEMCRSCASRENCLGGCPVMELVDCDLKD